MKKQRKSVLTSTDRGAPISTAEDFLSATPPSEIDDGNYDGRDRKKFDVTFGTLGSRAAKVAKAEGSSRPGGARPGGSAPDKRTRIDPAPCNVPVRPKYEPF